MSRRQLRTTNFLHRRHSARLSDRRLCERRPTAQDQAETRRFCAAPPPAANCAYARARETRANADRVRRRRRRPARRCPRAAASCRWARRRRRFFVAASRHDARAALRRGTMGKTNTRRRPLARPNRRNGQPNQSSSRRPNCSCKQTIGDRRSRTLKILCRKNSFDLIFDLYVC